MTASPRPQHGYRRAALTRSATACSTSHWSQRLAAMNHDGGRLPAYAASMCTSLYRGACIGVAYLCCPLGTQAVSVAEASAQVMRPISRRTGAASGLDQKGGTMIEVVVLASTIVGKFFVPLFKKGREGFTTGLTEASGRVAGESLVATAVQIWERVKRRFDRDDEKSAIDLFQAEPEDMEKLFTKLLA